MTTRVLVYAKEYFVDSYRSMFGALPALQVSYLTDRPTVGMTDIYSRFYSAFRKHRVNNQPEFDLDDVILRCRLLRNLDRGLAARMAVTMHAVLKENVLHRGYSAVVGQMVDNYVTHLLSLIAGSEGIPYVGLSGSYFPGHSQITLHSTGLPLRRRAVPGSEVEEIARQILVPSFRQDYEQQSTYSFLRHAARVLRNQAKKPAFLLAKLYHRDPLNFRLNVQPFAGQHRNLLDYARSSFFHADWQMRARAPSRPLVYMPLGYFPEATTDYWAPHHKFMKFEDTMVEIAASLGEHYTVLVKEHFHMLGIRPRGFYRDMGRVPGVILVPPAVISNDLISTYRPTVIVGGGSSGVEATLRGVPVVTYCKSSYWYDVSEATFAKAEPISEVVKAISKAKPSSVDKKVFLRRCLESTLSFDYARPERIDPRSYSQLMNFLPSA